MTDSTAPPPQDNTTDNPTGPPAQSAPTATLFGILGFVIGIAGFYTSFLDTYLKATVGFLNVVVASYAGLLLWRRYHRTVQHQAHRAATLGRHGWVRPATAAATVLGLAAANLAAFRPPAVVPADPQPTCMYQAPAQVSVPIRPGGYLEQSFRPDRKLIDAISVIIGIDRTLSPGQRPHPVEMRLLGPRGRPDIRITQADIVDNRYTRFNLATPWAVRDPRQTLRMRLTNLSDQPVGVYLKQATETDIVDDPTDGVRIVGHLDQESEYQKQGWVLSGCVEGRQ